MASGAQGQFRLLGIPIRVDPSLIVVLLVIATASRTSGSVLLAFLIGGSLSLVSHELGHALVARRVGASSIGISLQSFGGLTRYRLPTPSRARTIAITVAGPATGLVFGAVLWVLRAAANPQAFTTTAEVYHQLLFVTVGWSLINLLPVLPLDGGQLFEQLLVGSAQNRHRTAGIVSGAVAALAAAYFWHNDQRYPAIVFVLLTGYGVLAAVQGIAPGSPHRHGPSCDVFRAVVAGDYESAAIIARDGRTIDPALRALVNAVTSGDSTAEAALWELWQAKPDDAMVRSCVALLRAHRNDWPGILAMLRSGSAAIKLGACTACLRSAYQVEAFVEAAGIGEAVLRIFRKPLIAYNTACCWARAGNLELALRALMTAVDVGWSDWQRVDSDEDLESLRATASYRAWRASLPQREPTVPAVG